MKFLRLCLWICAGAIGVSSLRAQQTLTPEQQKQAADALRKALEGGPSTAPLPAPAETRPASPAQPAPAPVQAAPSSPADAKAAERARREIEA